MYTATTHTLIRLFAWMAIGLVIYFFYAASIPSCGASEQSGRDRPVGAGRPWLCPPFPAACPFRGSITPSPAPATSNGQADSIANANTSTENRWAERACIHYCLTGRPVSRYHFRLWLHGRQGSRTDGPNAAVGRARCGRHHQSGGVGPNHLPVHPRPGGTQVSTKNTQVSTTCRPSNRRARTRHFSSGSSPKSQLGWKRHRHGHRERLACAMIPPKLQGLTLRRLFAVDSSGIRPRSELWHGPNRLASIGA